MLRRFALIIALAAPASSAAHEDKYPMASTDYRKRAEQRLTRYRERVEQHMTAQRFTEAKRVPVRVRLAALEKRLRQRIEELARDGTITKREADDVKRLGKQGREALYREFAIAADEKKKKKKAS